MNGIRITMGCIVLAAFCVGQDAPETTMVSLSEPKIDVSLTGLIDLNVHHAETVAVLEMLSHKARVNIVATPAVTGRVTANLYDVTLDAALEAILTPQGLTYRRINNVIYVGGPDELRRQLSTLETRAIRLKYMTREDAAAAVAGVLSPEGRIAAQAAASEGIQQRSGGAAGLQGFGNAGPEFLIVTDYPDHVTAVERLLGHLDVRPRQVLIEATILRATLTEDNQLGVDLTLLGGVDFENVGSTSNAGANLVTGQLPPDRFQQTTINANTDLIGQFPGGGFTFGIIHNNIGAFIRALEEVTDVTVLANPKVIALNRHEAEVIVGRRDGYLTTTVTETAAVQQVDFLETGTQIRLRPIINDDGTVRLDVSPKDSNGGLTPANLPFEETTEATAQLLIEDGRTVLIGGLFRERTVSTRAQVPLVGNIPLLGEVFKRSRDTTVREEVIILLTVHVLKGDESQHGAFEALHGDAEKIRVGLRRGLLPHARSRLSDAYYYEALERYESGDYESALLNVRLSLHNDPRRPAALKLLERLQQRQVWGDDSSRIRTLIQELIQDDLTGGYDGAPLNRPMEHVEISTERGRE